MGKKEAHNNLAFYFNHPTNGLVSPYVIGGSVDVFIPGTTIVTCSDKLLEWERIGI